MCVFMKNTCISLPLPTSPSKRAVGIERRLIYPELAKQKLRAFQIVTNAITLPSMPVDLQLVCGKLIDHEDTALGKLITPFPPPISPSMLSRDYKQNKIKTYNT